MFEKLGIKLFKKKLESEDFDIIDMLTPDIRKELVSKIIPMLSNDLEKKINELIIEKGITDKSLIPISMLIAKNGKIMISVVLVKFIDGKPVPQVQLFEADSDTLGEKFISGDFKMLENGKNQK